MENAYLEFAHLHNLESYANPFELSPGEWMDALTADKRDTPVAAFFATHGWCQHAAARDGTGRPCYPSDSDAASWSLLGGMLMALDPPDYVRVVRLAAAYLGYDNHLVDRIRDWNNQPRRDWLDVVSLCWRLQI